MGLRTQRYGPTATNRCGGSHGPGVPRPTLAKIQRHRKYRLAPAAMIVTAGQAKGSGVAAPRVRINQGIPAAPEPGTTMVKRTLRSARLIRVECGLPVTIPRRASTTW